MGRNITPDVQQIVPINGAVNRNSANNGLIIDATGAQYYPSNGSGVLASTDYSKYISLNSLTSSAYGVSVNANASVNSGTLNTSTANLNFGQYTPYIQSYPYVYYPFSGQSNKYRFAGSTASSGSYVVVANTRSGYRQSTSNNIPAYVFNTSGVIQSVVTNRAAICWYDSTSSAYRVLGADSSSNPILYTSSDALTWSSTSSTLSSGSNTWAWGWWGGPSYYNTAQIASGLKVFVTTVASSSPSSNQYTLLTSTDGGATFTDRAQAITGGGNTYFTMAGSSSACFVNICYNGTTLFVPYSGGAWKYSTDDGASWSNTTISGVTSSVDHNQVGAIQGGNSSTWMYIYGYPTSRRVFVTTNGGQSFTSYNWTPTESVNTSYYSIPGDYDSANSRWCFVYPTSNNNFYAAISTNNGSTWSHAKINNATVSGQDYFMAWLDDAFYFFIPGQGIWRSTNGSTWTQLTTSLNLNYYQNPYYTLTSYVIIGNWVIRKSDQATSSLNSTYLLTNNSGYQKTFGNYITSDLYAQGQFNSNFLYQLTTSANVFTASLYSPYPYTNQQQGTGGVNPTTIEYWRIK